MRPVGDGEAAPLRLDASIVKRAEGSTPQHFPESERKT